MESEDEDEEYKNNGALVSVFEPRIVCGQLVEPFCEPRLNTQQAYLIAAATNLIWWAMHEALADGKTVEALKCGDMMLDIVRHEVSKEEWNEAKEILLAIIKRYNETNPFDSPSDN